jgi:hypothetical protein
MREESDVASKIVGLTGFARHGKDTVAGVLTAEAGYTRVAFADGVRSMALAVDPLLYGNVRLSKVIAVTGWDKAKATIPEVRRLLQVIGTEGVRDHIGPDSWVLAGKRKIDEIEGPVVVTDARFPNEAEAIKAWGGTMVRIVRLNEDGSAFDNGIGRDHPSESFVAGLLVDFQIEASSIEELEAKVRAACA